MGNRRIGRKRLYGVEKAGQKIDLESGAGIKDCIKSATQHRQGQEIITEILVDLGSSLHGGTVISSGTGANGDRSPIGVTATECFLTRLTAAKFGTVTEIRVVCLEATECGSANVGVSIETADNADGRSASGGGGTAPTGNTAERVADINALGEDTSSASLDNCT